MTEPAAADGFLRDLESEVEAELDLAESSRAPETAGASAEWLYEQADAQREEAGLRNLLGAIEAMEGDDPPAGDRIA